jgi:hypothetical protein
MMPAGNTLQSLLPFAVLAVVIALRWRGLSKARPLRVRRMVIAPVIYGLLVGFMLYALPPSGMGWLLFASGAVIGGVAGWQRARLMKLHSDAETGLVMIRQSPAGLVVLVGIILVRRVIMPPTQMQPQAGAGLAALPVKAMLATDATLGFALGMIVGYRIELWRRARELNLAS